MRYRVLVIEDEDTLRISIADRLQAEGYQVTSASRGDQGYSALTSGLFDCVLLDVMLPGKDGFEIARDVRAAGNQTPILMLTARRDVVDRIVGLKMGADDYLVKPFEMGELLARVEALIRRARAPQSAQSGVFEFGDVAVDFGRCEIHKSGAPVTLTALDFKLLTYMIEHRGETLSRDRLLREVWGYDAALVTRTVDVHIATLRQKIEPNPEYPRHILTVHRMGYKFLPQ